MMSRKEYYLGDDDSVCDLCMRSHSLYINKVSSVFSWNLIENTVLGFF